MTDVETPAAVMARIEAHLWDVFATGANPWRAGGVLLAKRLGMTAEVALRGVTELGGGFARVVQQEDDPRRFRLAATAEREKATPALILPRRLDGDDADLIAFSLTPDSRRFWRCTCKATHLGEPDFGPGGALLLRQDAHAYVGRMLKAAWASGRSIEDREDILARGFAAARVAGGFANMEEALAQPAEDLHRRAYLRGVVAARRAATSAAQRWAVEMRPPEGVLVLDPVAINWTRRGALAEAEAIEIVDAPANGGLGRALRRLNTTIGTPRGVPLYGVEAQALARGRAA
jgi:hypothetical protein